MRPLTDLFGASQFSAGLLVGTLALLVTLPAALGLAALFPAHLRRPGLVGPVFAVAVVMALDGTLGTDEIISVPAGVLLGLALLWLAGTIAARTPAPWLVGAIATVPGAAVLAGENAGLEAGWVPVLMVLAAVVIGAAAADFDKRNARYGLGPLLLFVTVAGIYATVPDTELMRAVVGVALPLVLLAWPYAAASLGAGGSYAAVGILLWVVPIDGVGRAGAIVGAVAAFALLYGEPIGRALARELEGRVQLSRFPIKRTRVIVVGAQLVIVAYATRIAGRVQSGTAALVLAIPAIAAALAFGVILVIPERRRRRRKKRPASERVPRPSKNGQIRRGSNGRGDPSLN
jgi:hypothetical protein